MTQFDIMPRVRILFVDQYQSTMLPHRALQPRRKTPLLSEWTDQLKPNTSRLTFFAKKWIFSAIEVDDYPTDVAIPREPFYKGLVGLVF